jgi:hypothetical protein
VDAFDALQAAEVDRRLRFPDPLEHARCAAHLDGFSLHAGVRIHASDREGLERRCRCALRPPFALHRRSQGPDGRLVYRMKRPRGGSLFQVLTPDELLARIATLVPPPRTRALRCHFQRMAYLVASGPDTLPLAGKPTRVFQWEDGRVELQHQARSARSAPPGQEFHDRGAGLLRGRDGCPSCLGRAATP